MPQNAQQQKQHELLRKKEASVVPLSRATVPEKTAFNKIIDKNGPHDWLTVQGQQINTITHK